MSGTEVLDVGRSAIWLTLQLSAPILLVGLVVGVALGFFQALTQIQEQTLTFAPKIVVMSVALFVLLPFMLSSIESFTEKLMDRIVSLG